MPACALTVFFSPPRAARATANDYAAALGLARRKRSCWAPPVLRCSALKSEGISEVWEQVRKKRRRQNEADHDKQISKPQTGRQNRQTKYAEVGEYRITRKARQRQRKSDEGAVQGYRVCCVSFAAPLGSNCVQICCSSAKLEGNGIGQNARNITHALLHCF